MEGVLLNAAREQRVKVGGEASQVHEDGAASAVEHLHEQGINIVSTVERGAIFVNDVVPGAGAECAGATGAARRWSCSSPKPEVKEGRKKIRCDLLYN